MRLYYKTHIYANVSETDVHTKDCRLYGQKDIILFVQSNAIFYILDLCMYYIAVLNAILTMVLRAYNLNNIPADFIWLKTSHCLDHRHI